MISFQTICSGGEGLARAGRHGEQDAFLAAHDALQRLAHRDLLEIAHFLAACGLCGCIRMQERIAAASLRSVDAVDRAQLACCQCSQLPLACVELPAAPELLWSREPLAGARAASESVPLDDLMAVRGESEGQPQVPRVVLGLLQAGHSRFALFLGFYDRDGQAVRVAEEVVDAFRGKALGAIAAQHDLARSVRPVRAIVVLARDLAARPAGDIELGVNQLGAGIGFVERHC